MHLGSIKSGVWLKQMQRGFVSRDEAVLLRRSITKGPQVCHKCTLLKIIRITRTLGLGKDVRYGQKQRPVVSAALLLTCPYR